MEEKPAPGTIAMMALTLGLVVALVLPYLANLVTPLSMVKELVLNVSNETEMNRYADVVNAIASLLDFIDKLLSTPAALAAILAAWLFVLARLARW